MVASVVPIAEISQESCSGATMVAMVTGVDRIVLAVPDLGQAAAELRTLFGVSYPPPAGNSPAWLDLANTALELVQCNRAQARIRGLVMRSHGVGKGNQAIVNDRGLALFLSGDGEDPDPRGAEVQTVADALSVDHLVLRTADADACIDLFRNQLGIRLALDRTVAQWGGRMLFFRTGGLTLEVIASLECGQRDHFWGIAYQTPDLDRAWQRMTNAGVELSGVREGRKPGTRVATIRSHHCGIPALLVEPRQPVTRP